MLEEQRKLQNLRDEEKRKQAEKEKLKKAEEQKRREEELAKLQLGSHVDSATKT